MIYILVNLFHMLHEFVPSDHVETHPLVEISIWVKFTFVIVFILSEVDV